MGSRILWNYTRLSAFVILRRNVDYEGHRLLPHAVRFMLVLDRFPQAQQPDEDTTRAMLGASGNVGLWDLRLADVDTVQRERFLILHEELFTSSDFTMGATDVYPDQSGWPATSTGVTKTIDPTLHFEWHIPMNIETTYTEATGAEYQTVTQNDIYLIALNEVYADGSTSFDIIYDLKGEFHDY